MHSMKNEVNQIILEILAKRKVKNQRSLEKLLSERGVKTGQSLLSRRLKFLGIEKRDGAYFLPQPKIEGLRITPVLPNLIVIKTLPGHAQAVAFNLDNQPLKGLAGTIAGDDTILCIIEGPRYMNSICNHLSLL